MGGEGRERPLPPACLRYQGPAWWESRRGGGPVLVPPGCVLCMSPSWDPSFTNITSALGRCPAVLLPQLTQQKAVVSWGAL